MTSRMVVTVEAMALPTPARSNGEGIMTLAPHQRFAPAQPEFSEPPPPLSPWPLTYRFP